MKRALVPVIFLVACSSGGGGHPGVQDLGGTNHDLSNQGCSMIGTKCCSNGNCIDPGTCVDGTCVSGTMCGHLNESCCNGTTCTTAGTSCIGGICTIPQSCGALDQPCCNGTTCTQTGTMCSGGYCVQQQACGSLSEPCCNGVTCTQSGTMCQAGYCVAKQACGSLSEPCCNGVTCTQSGTMCQAGYCVQACGQLSQPCCNGVTCNAVGATCQNGYCAAAPKANTGATCAQASDCAGTNAQCITQTGTSPNTITWPSGYCTSACDTSGNNVSTGINASCPGGGGSCVPTSGASGPGYCYLGCNAGTCRSSYSCFYLGAPVGVCAPTSLSQCNPTQKGSCGGSMTCVSVGADPVGDCFPACSPFMMTCQPVSGATTGCFINYGTDEGACLPSNESNGDGAACQSLNDCKSGTACHGEGSNVCRPYCGGPSNVMCTNGKMCVDLAPGMVSMSVAGVCAG